MLAYDAHPPAVSEVTIGSMIERDGTASRALFSFQTKLAGLHRSTKAESWIKDVFDVPALEDCRGESTYTLPFTFTWLARAAETNWCP